MAKSVRQAAARLVAAFLALCLTLPSPAYALRNESVEGSGLEELDRTLRQIGRAVGLLPNTNPPNPATQPVPSPAAGMEQQRAPEAGWVRARVLTGNGPTYDAIVLDQLPSELVPPLGQGLSSLLGQLNAEGPFIWVDGMGGLGAALLEARGLYPNMSPVLVDKKAWRRGEQDPATLAALEQQAHARGVNFWEKGDLPFIQEDMLRVGLRSLEGPPIRLVTMLNALHYNANPLAILQNIYNQLPEGALLLTNLYIPTEHPRAEALAKFYDLLFTGLRAKGIADFKLTDLRRMDGVQLNHQLETGPFPEFALGVVLRKGPGRLSLQADPVSSGFEVRTPRPVLYEVAWYGEDPMVFTYELPAAGMEEWIASADRLGKIAGLVIAIMQTPADESEKAIKQGEQDVVNALVKAFHLAEPHFVRQGESKAEEFRRDWLNLVYILADHRGSGVQEEIRWLTARKADEEWKADLFLRLVIVNGVVKRFKADPAPMSMTHFLFVTEMEYLPWRMPGAGGGDLSDALLKFSEPLKQGVISRTAEVIGYPRPITSAGMEELQAAFNRLLEEDAARRQEIQEKGGAWLDLNQVRAFGERYAAGLVVGPEAEVRDAGFLIYSDERLGNDRAEEIFSWLKHGKNVEEMADHYRELIQEGHLLVVRQEIGLTGERIRAELEHQEIRGVRVVVGDDAQVRELPPYAFERIAKDPRGQPVLFLSVAVRVQDEAGNIYTLILMA